MFLVKCVPAPGRKARSAKAEKAEPDLKLGLAFAGLFLLGYAIAAVRAALSAA